jgi:5'-nucleotidase
LSADEDDVRSAIVAGDAAATILPSYKSNKKSEQVRIAFDGDAVIFSDEAEQIYQEQGLKAFEINETQSAKTPLSGGPFKKFLKLLHEIQSEYPEDQSPIRTALVTARGAPAHERAIRTLREWNIRIDEVFFLGGLKKGPFLDSFGADIFFDDQKGHYDSAREFVATGHVPNGVKNTVF